MKLSELFLLVLFLFSFSACVSQQPDTKSKCYATEYVNPFIGTDFTGNTYPGAQAPFGMVQLRSYLRLFLSGQHDCRF